MPIRTLDPRTALLVIDLQQGLVANPMLIQVDTVIERTAALVSAFRSAGLPVVLANVDGAVAGRNDYARPPREQPDGYTTLIAELGQQSTDLTLTRAGWGAFVGTELNDTLKSLGVTQVVIAGIATSFGVESTAREAYGLGYNVTLATDAMTDMNADAHTRSLTWIFPALGETGPTADLIEVLAAR